MLFPLLGKGWSFSGWEVGPSLSGLELALPSLGEGCPFLLAVGVAPSGRGRPFCLGLGVCQLSVVIVMIRNETNQKIFKYDGGGQEDGGWPLGLGLALPSLGVRLDPSISGLKLALLPFGLKLALRGGVGPAAFGLDGMLGRGPVANLLNSET